MKSGQTKNPLKSRRKKISLNLTMKTTSKYKKRLKDALYLIGFQIRSLQNKRSNLLKKDTFLYS